MKEYSGDGRQLCDFKNLLREAEAAVREHYPEAGMDEVFERLHRSEEDREFWAHRIEGAAFFVSPDIYRVVELYSPVRSFFVVSNSFHIKPLLRIFQSADSYQVLCLSQGSVALYEGTKYSLHEVALHDVPRSLEEALGSELTEPQVRASSNRGPAAAGLYHGHGGSPDKDLVDRERFYRAVDRAILEQYSRVSKKPLILCALPEDQSIFREVTHNPFLMPCGIYRHPSSVTKEALQLEAWMVFEPEHEQRIAAAIDKFLVAKAHNAGSDDLVQVAHAAAAGRVQTLLVDADRHIPGRVSVEDEGGVFVAPIPQSGVDDVLDDIAEQVIDTGGEILVIPPAQMPTESGIAATYRY